MIFPRRVKRKNVTARVTSSFINLCVKTTFKGYSMRKLLGERTSRKHQSYRSSPLASNETRLFRSLSISHKKKWETIHSRLTNSLFQCFGNPSIYLISSSVHPPMAIYPLIHSSIHPSVLSTTYLVPCEVDANYFLVSFYRVRASSKFLPSPSFVHLSLPFFLAGILWDKSYDVTILTNETALADLELGIVRFFTILQMINK